MPAQSRPPCFPTARFAPIGLSLMLGLGGCASQQTITEQTDPLRKQLGQIETSTAQLSRSAEANAAETRARETLLVQQIDALRGEIRTLQAGLAELHGQVRQSTERANQAELRLDEQSTLTRDATEQIQSLQDQSVKSELRLDELATAQRDSEDSLALLTEHQTQTDLRLDEAMTLAREAIDGLSQAAGK